MLAVDSLAEVVVFVHDMAAGVRFYRDVLGMPLGLNYFGHAHLDGGNMPLVLRYTWHRCPQNGPFGGQLVLRTDDYEGVTQRLTAANVNWQEKSLGLLVCRDPSGNRLLIRRKDRGKEP